MSKPLKKAPDTRKKSIHKDQKKSSVSTYAPSALLSLLVVTILGIIIYSNTFDCTFHLDDNPSILMNSSIRNLSDIKTIWDNNHSRFTGYWSFALNYHFGAYDVWGYHLVNLIIHLINACLVYGLTRLLFSTPVLRTDALSQHASGYAFAVALLFVSHPLATQSVTYIVQRLASLVTLFYVVTILLYIQGRLKDSKSTSRWLFFAGALLSAILASYSKENAFTLPIAVVLVEGCFFRTKSISLTMKKSQWLMLVGGLGVLSALVISRFASSAIFRTIPPELGNTYSVTPWTYLLTQFSVIVTYIRLLILPLHQNLDYDFPIATSFFEIRTMLSFAVLVSLLVVAVYLFNKKRLISFGIFWFFLTLAIESSIVPITDVIFEHRTYLPSFGFFLVLMTIVYTYLWQKNRTVTSVLIVMLVSINSVLAYQRNKIWKNEETLWKDVVQQSPGKARPYVNLGMYYIERGEYQVAAPFFAKAYELNNAYFDAANNLGVCEVAKGDNKNALVHFNRALELDTTHARVYFGRGLTWIGLSEWNNAIADFTSAITINPEYAKAYGKRAYVLSRLSKWEEALKDFDTSIKLDSTNSTTYFDRGRLFGFTGRYTSALEDFSRAIMLEPGIPDGYVNRAITYENLGDFAKAVVDYDRYLQYMPNDTMAKNRREAAFAKTNISGEL